MAPSNRAHHRLCRVGNLRRSVHVSEPDRVALSHRVQIVEKWDIGRLGGSKFFPCADNENNFTPQHLQTELRASHNYWGAFNFDERNQRLSHQRRHARRHLQRAARKRLL